MKRITDTEAFCELASARDGLGEIFNQLSALHMKSARDDTTEGRLLAHQIRSVQQQLTATQKILADMAACYH